MAFVECSGGGGAEEGVLPVNPSVTTGLNIWIETDDALETESVQLEEIVTGE